MNQDTMGQSVWGRTVDALRVSRMPDTRGMADAVSRTCARLRACTGIATISVRVVTRTAVNMVLVDWSDSTACRYGEQLWRESRAERKGHCALSGLPIEKGELIYRPRLRRPIPQNADAMIRADQIALLVFDEVS